MAYSSSTVAPRSLEFTQSPARAKSSAKPSAKSRPKRGLFGRLLDGMMAARLRQAEREVARYLADTGGKFTDEAEREIERRFLSTPSRW
jgi:hypothetical protein